MFGDLVPGAVVKMADLLFVLHHVGWLSSLFVLHCDIILDGLKVLPMLMIGAAKISVELNHARNSQIYFGVGPHLIKPLKEAVFILSAPRLPLPTRSLLVSTWLLFLSRSLALWVLGNSCC